MSEGNYNYLFKFIIIGDSCKQSYLTFKTLVNQTFSHVTHITNSTQSTKSPLAANSWPRT